MLLCRLHSVPRLWVGCRHLGCLSVGVRGFGLSSLRLFQLFLSLFAIFFLSYGRFFVMVSGAMFFEPFLLASKYSFNACMDSSPMKVLAKSFVFCVIILI